MDADLGVMTVRRQGRLTVSLLTRWSRSANCKSIGSNREPLATVSSDGSAILSRLPTASIQHKNHVNQTLTLTAFSWKSPEPMPFGAVSPRLKMSFFFR